MSMVSNKHWPRYITVKHRKKSPCKYVLNVFALLAVSTLAARNSNTATWPAADNEDNRFILYSVFRTFELIHQLMKTCIFTRLRSSSHAHIFYKLAGKIRGSKETAAFCYCIPRCHCCMWLRAFPIRDFDYHLGAFRKGVRQRASATSAEHDSSRHFSISVFRNMNADQHIIIYE